ncbi:hypothetical protein GCM10023347_45320 [Streptomyces chumphonensis]
MSLLQVEGVNVINCNFAPNRPFHTWGEPSVRAAATHPQTARTAEDERQLRSTATESEPRAAAPGRPIRCVRSPRQAHPRGSDARAPAGPVPEPAGPWRMAHEGEDGGTGTARYRERATAACIVEPARRPAAAAPPSDRPGRGMRCLWP